MSKLFKQNSGGGPVRRPFAGDIIRSDQIRSYIVNPAASGSNVSACFPDINSAVNTASVSAGSTVVNAASKSAAGSTAASVTVAAKAISPLSPSTSVAGTAACGISAPLACYDTDTTVSNSSFSSILSAAATEDFPPPPSQWIQSLEESRARGIYPGAGNIAGGISQNEPFYENTCNGYHNNEGSLNSSIYENQQIIDIVARSRASSSSCEPVYENSSMESANQSSRSSMSQIELEPANQSGRNSMSQFGPAIQNNHNSLHQFEPANQSSRNSMSQSQYSDRSIDSSNRRSCGGSARQSLAYDEPWDLESAQVDVMNDGSGWYRRIQDNMSSSLVFSNQTFSNKSSVERSTRAAGENQIQSDISYVMPHEKDERNRDGYERPWDLRPHQKDERPGGEYDRPWDERLKNVECDLAAAKISKDGSKISRSRAERLSSSSDYPPPSGDTRGQDGYEKPWDLKPHQRDDRPASEYEQAWDGRLKDAEGDVVAAKLAKEASRLADGIERRKAAIGSTDAGSAFGIEMPSGYYPQIDRRGQCDVNSGQPRRWSANRLSANSSLEEQSWFHGCIGRNEAEDVMQGTREGSFLVRRSEVNASDYSLSIRSQNGFIHLKIVVDCDGRIILGQFSKPFSSISLMVQHYSINKLPIKGAEHISLTNPIPNDVL